MSASLVHLDARAAGGERLTSALLCSFASVAPDGFERVRDDDRYFAGRSRKFAIQIEGRFKQRPGVKPYTADEVRRPVALPFLPRAPGR